MVSVLPPRGQIGQLKISLRSVLDQWSAYKRASEEINGHLMEGRYSVSRFRLLTGSLEAVELQAQSLQVGQGRGERRGRRRLMHKGS
jgi:nesprin-1